MAVWGRGGGGNGAALSLVGVPLHGIHEASAPPMRRRSPTKAGPSPCCSGNGNPSTTLCQELEVPAAPPSFCPMGPRPLTGRQGTCPSSQLMPHLHLSSHISVCFPLSPPGPSPTSHAKPSLRISVHSTWHSQHITLTISFTPQNSQRGKCCHASFQARKLRHQEVK